jgi:hypothetical protein
MSHPNKNVNQNGAPAKTNAVEVTPSVTVNQPAPVIEGAEYKPAAGDKFTLSITGVLTEKKRGGGEGAGHIRGTLYNDDALVISEDGKKIILNTTTESTPLVKRFASISSMRVSRGLVTLASAKHADGKYDLTCFDATESRPDEKHAYKAGKAWASARASANYSAQTNAGALITLMRQAIAKHYGLTGGPNASKTDKAETERVRVELTSKLDEQIALNASLLARLAALEAAASVKDAVKAS